MYYFNGDPFRHILSTDPYKQLANAVIYQAVLDYRNPKTKPAERRAIAKFFLSDYFMLLSDLDGEDLVHRLETERYNNEEDSRLY